MALHPRGHAFFEREVDGSEAVWFYRPQLKDALQGRVKFFVPSTKKPRNPCARHRRRARAVGGRSYPVPDHPAHPHLQAPQSVELTSWPGGVQLHNLGRAQDAPAVLDGEARLQWLGGCQGPPREEGQRYSSSPHLDR
jgi:hypothetical protein